MGTKYAPFSGSVRSAARSGSSTGALRTMLTEPVAGKLLDDFVVASTLSLVMIGGSDTFPKALGATIHRLWQHPDQRARVAADPGLARDAFLEALRIDTPTQMLGRTCVAATEIEGQRIEPGQGVMFMWAAANRDEREFARPDAYDLDRRPPHKATQELKFCLQDVLIIYFTLRPVLTPDFVEHAEPIVQELFNQFISGLHDPEQVQEQFLNVYKNALVYGYEEALEGPYKEHGLNIHTIEDWPEDRINFVPDSIKSILAPALEAKFNWFRKNLARQTH